MVGDGLFKRGTASYDGMLQCPYDMLFVVTSGNSQSDNLDKIEATLERLTTLRKELRTEGKEGPHEPGWDVVQEAQAAANAVAGGNGGKKVARTESEPRGSEAKT